ncbi:hypothetical protein A3A39_02555 [Candidatus Kaiserbacteria bacterium RIFCSPLOWO2_01_FULL_54_13]|uniref:C-type lysozyme inhibitor domain-containing protein n=1 Tax=Candidatus Kaiserbacteria bacterium RIFCSPLOWO2_01_FULL_54_13 TaxID=1798512 RepID=A0A1F6F3J8_9BACT|nr:MAG: hypothetical protein A3A39_02555 [Candidatus Kaiserbacteria bacterium RIFCSPLOWO2_01_FULL_54_13]
MKINVWHVTVAVLIIGYLFSAAGLVAYLLYGPDVTVTVPEFLWSFGRSTSTQSVSETNPVVPDSLAGRPGTLFECESDKALKAGFFEGKVHLALSDGRQLSLPEVFAPAESGTSPDASAGVTYANTDESFVFHTRDYGASVEESNVVTFSNCVMRP